MPDNILIGWFTTTRNSGCAQKGMAGFPTYQDFAEHASLKGLGVGNQRNAFLRLITVSVVLA